jgi:hypothetical protein
MIAIPTLTALDELTDPETVAAHFASIVIFFRDSTDEQLAEICRVAMTPIGFNLTCMKQEEFVQACISSTIARVLETRRQSDG